MTCVTPPSWNNVPTTSDDVHHWHLTAWSASSSKNYWSKRYPTHSAQQRMLFVNILVLLEQQADFHYSKCDDLVTEGAIRKRISFIAQYEFFFAKINIIFFSLKPNLQLPRKRTWIEQFLEKLLFLKCWEILESIIIFYYTYNRTPCYYDYFIGFRNIFSIIETYLFQYHFKLIRIISCVNSSRWIELRYV